MKRFIYSITQYFVPDIHDRKQPASSSGQGHRLPEQLTVNPRFTFADPFQPDVLCSEAEEY